MGKRAQNSYCDHWTKRQGEFVLFVPWTMTTMVPSSSGAVPLFLFLSSSLHVPTPTAPWDLQKGRKGGYISSKHQRQGFHLTWE